VPDELLSAEQVAERLGLHVRTVRNYVRDGRLKAVRIGKQYRITRADLAAFTGGGVPSSVAETAGRVRQAEASSVVQIDAVDRRTADRLSTLLTTSASGRVSGQQLRIQTIYDEERAGMKVIVIGGLGDTAEVLRLIGVLVEAGS
jgi:excisionase family DNA binding protein